MALWTPLRLIPPNAIDALTATHRGAFLNRLGPALHVCIRVDIEELARFVEHAHSEGTIPRMNRETGDDLNKAGTLYSRKHPLFAGWCKRALSRQAFLRVLCLCRLAEEVESLSSRSQHQVKSEG